LCPLKTFWPKKSGLRKFLMRGAGQARAVECLRTALDHRAGHLTLARAMRMRKAGIIDWSAPLKSWVLIPDETAGVANVLADRAFMTLVPGAARQAAVTG
jgi:hypothetical protein